MKRFLLIAMLLLVGGVQLNAQSVTVTGHLKSGNTSNVTNRAFLRFRLRNFSGNTPRVIGTGDVVQTQFDVLPDGTGTVTTSIYANDFIMPVNTFWTVETWYNGVFQFSYNYGICAVTQVTYCATVGGTLNLDSASPISFPTPPSPYLPLPGPAGPAGPIGPQGPPGPAGGLGSGPTLQTNTVTNTSQTLLNLKNGTNSSISSDGSGGVTVAVPTPGSSGQLLQNSSGVFGASGGLTTPDGNSLNVKGPIPWVDATVYGARQFGSPPNTITVTSPGSSPTVTTTGVSDFIKNDGITIPQAGAATSQTTPGAPTVTNIGANGSTTISYKCVGVDSLWGLTAASSAGTTTTAPTVFGAAATAISTISRSANVVTVTTSTNMPFSSGTYHATIADVTGGTTNFSGLFLVTVSNATTLTYSQTGANESGTVTPSSSYVLFENAFVLTQVASTAGSNTIVLTTDINHNLQQQLVGNRPTKIYLDGISFPGEATPGFADGLFTITSVTANTITITTPYVATLTQNASASLGQSNAKGALQMTATVWAEQMVTCPQNADGTPSDGGVYYAVYADYGSGYAPIGFTPWEHSIFFDYGPAFTRAGFVASPAMNLPATPPASPQKQVFAAQITNIVGSTLTLDRNVPTGVTSVTAYHDDSIPLQNAVNASCGPGSTFASVYLPQQVQNNVYYYFNAPTDLSGGSNHCSRASVLDAAYVYANGTIWMSNSANFQWVKPKNGFNVVTAGNVAGPQVTLTGNADPLMASTTICPLQIDGISFLGLSNGQNDLVNIAPGSSITNSTFGTNGSAFLSSVPLFLGGGGFSVHLQNITGGYIPNVAAPLAGAPGNSGQVMFWPVPSVEMAGGPSNFTNLIWDGANYWAGNGIEIDSAYPGAFTNIDYVKIYNVQTFQEPWQPFLMIEGVGNLNVIDLQNIQMDSIENPVIANLNGVVGQLLVRGANPGGSLFPVLTGNPVRSAVDTVSSSASITTQNQNEFTFGPGRNDIYGPLTGTTPAFSIYCEGGTGNALSILNSSAAVTSGLSCSNGQLFNLETTAPSGAANNDILYADSTAHRWTMVNNNEGTPEKIAGFTASLTNNDCAFWSGTTGILGDAGGKCAHYTITPTNGDCVTWSGTGGLLGDAGAACGAGAGGMNTNMNNMANPTLMSQSLVPASVNSIAVGTQAIPFTNVFIGTVANQAGSFDSSALTANHVIKFPNADSTAVQNCPSASHQFLTQILQSSGACTTAQPTLADIAAGLAPSGLFDFTNSTMEIPEANGFTATVNSTIGLDTTANSVHLWINSADSVAAAFASAPAGSKCVQSSGTTGAVSEAAAACGTTTPSSSDTFTNKTLNAESTGNSLSEPIRAYFTAAGCNNSAPASGFDIGVTNGPTPQCTGTTVRKGVLQFARGNVAYINFHLPKDWNSGASVDLEVCFTTTDTTNGHVTSFNIQTGFNSITGAATDDPSLNGSQALSVTTGASQTSGGELCGLLTGLTTTGSSADGNMEIAVTRNNSGTDTNTDTAVSVKNAQLIIGVTKNSANR
jgi:hypothetical protein